MQGDEETHVMIKEERITGLEGQISIPKHDNSNE